MNIRRRFKAKRRRAVYAFHERERQIAHMSREEWENFCVDIDYATAALLQAGLHLVPESRLKKRPVTS